MTKSVSSIIGKNNIPKNGILSIDIGERNVGVSYFDSNNYLLIGFHKNWSDWKKNKLNYMIELEEYNFDKVIIEQQLVRKYVSRMSFIEGYFIAKGKEVKIVKPVTFGLALKTRKERKQYSIDRVNDLINELKITKPFNLIYDYHDVCDAMLMNINHVNASSVKNIQIYKINSN